MKLKAPYVWFGGKSKIAPQIWERLGDVHRYIEPFAGSIATLLARPEDYQNRDEVVNDLDGFIPNFWRAIKYDPLTVAAHCKEPIFECDLHSRNIWLEGQRSTLAAKLEADPFYHDPLVAAWWVWVMGASITGIFGAKGPWSIKDGMLVKGEPRSGIKRSIPLVSKGHVHGIQCISEPVSLFLDLQERLQNVKVLCGDWERCVKTSVTDGAKSVGIFLDPPYGAEDYDTAVYAEGKDITKDVRDAALELGKNPTFRVALSGYEGEHNELEDHGWTKISWKTSGGMARIGNGGTQGIVNADRERVWFSPHCLSGEDAPSLF